MNPLIVVPVFNCDPVIEDVLASLLEETSQDILVVDDGSDQPVRFFADNPRVFILRKNRNRGKGAALQTAFQWAIEKKFTHVLSFDGDGQHCAPDTPKLLDLSLQNSKALIIGHREFDSTVPRVSRFGRKFSNFWVWYQTGIKVEDSQSGLRIYPLEELKSLRFFTGRYDFEIEVLVRLIWRQVRVLETSVGVIYPSKEDRISHFDKLWDNARITCLNIFLIIYSLVFFQRSIIKVLLAGGVAFLCSLIGPLILALVVAIFTCVVLRLNAILVLIGFLVLRIT